MRTEPSILVVDDEPAIRDFLEDVLQDEGYRVYVATDGRRALDALQHELPDLVLTDLMMPGIDGRALASQMRATPTTAHIPIVLVSAAYVSRSDDPFTAVLHKPFQLNDLLTIVRRCLE